MNFEDLKLIRVTEEVKFWVRDIYFEYEGEEQYVELAWEEGYSYEIRSSNLTPRFKNVLDKWHETSEELFEAWLDDLTWLKVDRK